MRFFKSAALAALVLLFTGGAAFAQETGDDRRGAAPAAFLISSRLAPA